MKIDCPHCRKSISITHPKAGRFKPRCSGCGKPFGLQIDDSVPPKVRVGRLAVKAAASQTVAVARRSVTVPSTDATIDEETAGGVAVDETIDSAAGDANLDQTMPSRMVPAVSAAGEPTVDSATGLSGGPGVDDAMPARLGGFRLTRPLGAGAMGAVYLARQMSLDRDVAIKVIRGRWAQNPTTLARFIREAYAAAKLSHHNVVGVHDFGQDGGTHYFAMECLTGGSLADRLKQSGPMRPRAAATAIVQAARGLAHAHAAGMVHRDIKPANLLIGPGGIVKVADLGLVKAPDVADEPIGVVEQTVGVQGGSTATAMGSTMGTPAYMPPEQADDAAGVDHRADIYSLGCTMYALMAGRSPFAGSTTTQTLAAHRSGPVPDLAKTVPAAGPELASIVTRCLQKSPDDRYRSLAEMINDLQRYLGGGEVATTAVTAKQNEELQQQSRRFADEPLAKLRVPVAAAGIGAAVVLTLVLLATAPVWAVMPFAALPGGIVWTLAIAATGGRNTLATHARSWLLTRPARWWLTTVVGGVLVVAGLFITSTWLPAVIGLTIGSAAGAGYAAGLLVQVHRRRDPVLAEINKTLRSVRLSGAGEDAVRQSIVDAAGRDWEELYETLFGYEEMIEARTTRLAAGEARTRRRFWTWRDRPIESLRRAGREQKAEADEAKLCDVERRGLEASGVSPADARRQARQVAAAWMAQSEEFGRVESSATDLAIAAAAKRERIKAMMAEARSGKYRPTHSGPPAVVRWLLGGQIRFVLAASLAVVFGLWLQHNGLTDRDRLQSMGQAATRAATAAARQAQSGGVSGVALDKITTDPAMAIGQLQPLDWPLIGPLVSHFGTGAAALMLGVLSLAGGWRISLVAIPAAALGVAGPSLGVPDFGPPGLLAGVLAVVIGWVGAWCVRDRRPVAY